MATVTVPAAELGAAELVVFGVGVARLLAAQTAQRIPRISTSAATIATIHTQLRFFGPCCAVRAAAAFDPGSGIGAVEGPGVKCDPDPNFGAADAEIGSAIREVWAVSRFSGKNASSVGTALIAAGISRRRIASIADASAVASLGRSAGSLASRHIIKARAGAGMLSGSGGGGSFTWARAIAICDSPVNGR